MGAALVAVVIWLARRLAPRFAEFDGQVIRQTFIEHDEDPDEYRVVVDDGVRPRPGTCGYRPSPGGC